MKRLLATTLVLSAFVVFADAATPAASAPVTPAAGTRVKKRDMTKRRAESRERVAKQGGMIQEAYTGNSIRLISTQTQVPLEEIVEIGKAMEKRLGVPVQAAMLPREADNNDLIEKAFSLEKTGVVIAIVDKQRGSSLLCAPESAWAIVNVDVLASDKPDAEKLNRRVRQEAWRGLVFVLNGTDSQMQPCLMTIVRSLGNLDRNPLIEPSPEPLFKMQDGLTARGMRRARRATYLRACSEGWAPAPTNDIQKAIWDAHHAKPTEPMKIKFDAKKGE